jgi:protoporphyrinogen oxidase
MRQIVVVGAGLSGLAAAYRLQQAGLDVRVLEADDRPGGRCATTRRDGFIIDTGPEIVAGSYVRYLRLVDEIGLADAIIPCSPVIGTVRGGRVYDTDTAKILGMALTPLLSPAAKIRFLWGLRRVWKQVQNLDAYGMADFSEHDDPQTSAEQRALDLFGPEAAAYLIDPLVRMIGGAHPARISQLTMLGGLKSWSTALCNLRGGLDRVPRAVAQKLAVTYGATVTAATPSTNGVTVAYQMRDGATQRLEVDGCVLACQIQDAARLCPTLAASAEPLLTEIPYAKLIDIKLAYGAACASRAFVCQVPSCESRELLMYTLTHNKAPDRAPPAHSLFTLYTADDVYEEMAAKSDEQLLAWARSQIEPLYREVSGHFLFGQVGRYARAGYRAGPGFFQLMSRLIRALPQSGRIHLAGDVFGAGSMEAAVMWGERAASNLLGAIGTGTATAAA